MLWKDLIKLVQEKGLEEKPVNASLSIMCEEGTLDANGSIFSYLNLRYDGSLECVLDDLKEDPDTGDQIHPRTSRQAYENSEDSYIFIQNAEEYGPED